MHCCQGVLLLPWKLQAGGISAKMMVVSAGTQASIYVHPHIFITTHLPRTYLR